MKKVVSVVLALIMVFACFSIAVSAVSTDAALEITVKPTGTSYKKGDIVTFEVIYERSADLAEIGNPLSIAFGFDSSVFEDVEGDLDLSTSKNFTEATNSFVSTGYPLEGKITASISTVVVTATNSTADTAKSWDKMIMFKTGSDYFVDAYANPTASFAFKLKIKEDASDTGSYVVGVADTAVQSSEINIADPLGGIQSNTYSLEEYGFTVPSLFKFIDGTVTVEGAEDSKIIKAVKDNDGKVLSYVGWGNYDETKDTCDEDMTTGKLNFAIRGTFDAADIAPEEGKISFDEGNKRTVQEIETLSASAKIGGVEKGPYSTQFIYGAENGEGSYEYFVVIAGVDYADITDGTLTAEITFGGTLTAGGAISGEKVTVNLKDAYDAAVARTLPAYSAS